jgi:hypothetical protein
LQSIWMMRSSSSLPMIQPSNNYRRRHFITWRIAVLLLLLASVAFYHITTYISFIYSDADTATGDETISFFWRIKLFTISFLRMTVFPLLRHPIQCIPVSTKATNVTINMASIYHRDEGGWTRQLREMYQLSEKNKVEYVTRNEHCMNTLHNGSKWAYENIGRLSHVKNTWFKPMFVEELIQNMTTAVENGTRPDWIIYLDHDIIIMNQDFDLRKLITLSGGDVNDNVAMILSTDAEGINTGAFIIRVNDFGMKIMNAWTEGYASGKDDQSYLWTIFDDDGYLKQTTSSNESNHTKKSFVPRMKLVRPCALNSGGGIERKRGKWWPYFEGVYCKGDFAVHFFGRPDKLVQMKDADRGSLGFISR